MAGKEARLEISQEKTRVVNVKRKYSEFLGFKIKVHKKSDKYVVKSRVSDKKIQIIRNSLAEQAKKIAKPTNGKSERDEIMLYNAMVVGEQNYYRLATDVSIDFHSISRIVMTILTNRLRRARGCRLTKEHTTIREKNKSIQSEKVGRKLSKYEKDRYGNSRMLRFIKGSDEPIYPIGYVHHKTPMAKKDRVK